MAISRVIFLWGITICSIILFSGCGPQTDHQAQVQTEWSAPFDIQLKRIPTSESGVSFNNQLYDEGNLNPFVWNFIYTGGGVATGDLDNDGLPDIYFAGNQVSDKIYRNLGNFQFEDVSIKAGIIDQTWSTGVTMADINSDGLLDIYVCKTSPTLQPDQNRNKLYINQGNFEFEEQAVKYGIADIGYSIQATFFDIDQDNDLDMYLVNQPLDEFAKYLYPPGQVEQYPVYDRLFLFENGRYRISPTHSFDNELRYGLGVSLGDFDKNGWTDLYIASDYHHADQLLMNQNGQLTDELKSRMPHISFYSMGSDCGDINNDGWQDIMVLDMAFGDHLRSKTNMESMNPERFFGMVADGHHYQYAQNALHLNRGDGTFIDVAQMTGVAKTDWSWSTLLSDLDFDGHQDIVVTNGILKDMKNNDFAQFVNQNYAGQIGPNNYKDAMTKLPSTPVANHIFKNRGNFIFDDISTQCGFDQKGFSHGLALADFDGDNKLDLVINEMNQPASIFQNVSSSYGNGLLIDLKGMPGNTHGLGVQVTAFWGDQRQTATMQASRGYYSASEPVLSFGVGKATIIDSIRVDWNHQEMTTLYSVLPGQRLTIDYTQTPKKQRDHIADAPFFESMSSLEVPHQERPFDDYKDQVLLPHQLSDLGPFMSVADVNGDRRVDLYCSGAAGQKGQLYLQSRGGEFRLSVQKAFEADADHEDGQSVFFDYDQDGDLDLYVVSGSNEFHEGSALLEDRLYDNDGRGNFSRNTTALPANLRINGQAVEAFDFGGDGDLDLLVGGRQVSGRYPISPKTALLENENGKFYDVTASKMPWSEPPGLVTDIEVFDVDHNGLQDLLIVGEWMSPTIAWQNEGRLFRHVDSYTGPGFWWTIEKMDVDNDGDDDFLLGNLGLNNKFSNRKDKSLEVRAGDLDQNGDHDIVLSIVKGDLNLPVRGRECSTDEMPFISEKFNSFAAYGQAQVNDLLTQDQLSNATTKRIDTFHHVLLVNQGEFSFIEKSLPMECQTGPIKDFEVTDINNDGFMDVVFVGNHYSTEVETVRYDALFQGYCINDGNGNLNFEQFRYLPHRDYRGIKIIRTSDQRESWILASNRHTYLVGKRTPGRELQ